MATHRQVLVVNDDQWNSEQQPTADLHPSLPTSVAVSNYQTTANVPSVARTSEASLSAATGGVGISIGPNIASGKVTLAVPSEMFNLHSPQVFQELQDRQMARDSVISALLQQQPQQHIALPTFIHSPHAPAVYLHAPTVPFIGGSVYLSIADIHHSNYVCPPNVSDARLRLPVLHAIERQSNCNQVDRSSSVPSYRDANGSLETGPEERTQSSQKISSRSCQEYSSAADKKSLTLSSFDTLTSDKFYPKHHVQSAVNISDKASSAQSKMGNLEAYRDICMDRNPRVVCEPSSRMTEFSGKSGKDKSKVNPHAEIEYAREEDRCSSSTAEPAASQPTTSILQPKQKTTFNTNQKEEQNLTVDEHEEILCPKRKKRKYSHESFAQKLHRVVTDIEASGRTDVMEFLQEGGVWVYEPEIFVAEVMPKYFRGSTWACFRRQLFSYNFPVIKKGRNKGAFKNPNFQRNQPELCKLIKRDDKYDKKKQH